MQKEDIQNSIPFDRILLSRIIMGNIFLYLKQFQGYSGLNVIALYFDYYRIAKKKKKNY